MRCAQTLDWLCLNLEEDKLPRSFRESHRPTNDDSKAGEIVIVKPKKREEIQELEAVDKQRTDEERELANLAALKWKQEQEEKRREEERAAREWILRNVERYEQVSEEEDDDDDDEDEEEEQVQQQEDPEQATLNMEQRLESARDKAQKAKESKSRESIQAVTTELQAIRDALTALNKRLSSMASGTHGSIPWGGKGLNRNTASKQGRYDEGKARELLVKCTRMVTGVRGELQGLAKALTALPEKKSNEASAAIDDESSGAALDIFAEDPTPAPSLKPPATIKVVIAKPKPDASSSSKAPALTSEADSASANNKGTEPSKKKSGGKGKDRDAKDKSKDGESKTEAAASAEADDGTPPTAVAFRCTSSELNSWTGKTPKKMLQEMCQKKKMAKPRFDVVSHNPPVCRLSLGKQTYELPEHVDCDKMIAAENAVATYALMKLAEGRQLHRMLPPSMRDLWLRWEQEEEAAKAREAAEKQDKRDALFADLSEMRRQLAAAAAAGSGGNAHDATGGETGDAATRGHTWEDHADQSDDKDKEMTEADKEKENARLKSEYEAMRRSLDWQDMWSRRKELPIHAYSTDLVKSIRDNQVVIVVGETG
jgi:hypothetical protein